MRGLFTGLVASLAYATAALAADICVLPVGLNLGVGHDRAAITVTNQGAEPVVMQLETVSWSQTDGRDRYVPTRDLLVNPPLFKIPPRGSQVLRVGLRRPPTGERELAYRLFLREVPPPSAAPADGTEGDGARVRVVLELRLPVYVAPARVIRAQQWQGRRTADGGIEVALLNTGNVHQVVAGLKLSAADATPDTLPVAATKTSVSVFPGQRHIWPLPPQETTPGRRYTLQVTTDRGTYDVALDLDHE